MAERDQASAPIGPKSGFPSLPASQATSERFPALQESTKHEDATSLVEISRQLSGRKATNADDQISLDSSGLDQRFARVRPKDTRRAARWISWSVMTCALAAVLVCAWLLWTFWSWQRDAAQRAQQRFASHPVVLEELGPIQACRFALLETFSPECPEEDVVAFRVRGERNAGFLYIQTSEAEETAWAGLRIDQQFWPLEND